MGVTYAADVDFSDLFCGAGGSISGMADAGFRLVVGANHDARSIATVSANHRDADFLCVDINHYDMRRLPKTRVLWASVICTEMSPAGGNKKHRGQLALELDGPVKAETYVRTRACALDVIRATEVHHYDAVIVENVVEFARDWELYDWWVQGMCLLGYQVQTVNVSAAHVYGEGNPPAPQWRDRIYIVFTRNGIPLPDLEPRPPSWCGRCDGLVEGRQVWKRPDRRRIGKYGQQYLYRCPHDGSVVEPLVAPAAAALDLDDLGTRIGDRSRPLGEKTRARIQWGIDTFVEPVVAQVAGNTFERPGYYRARPAHRAPLTTRNTTGEDALVTPAFITMARRNGTATPAAGEPLRTVTTSGSHHGLVTPPGAFIAKAYGGNAQPSHLVKPLTDPLGTVTTKDHHYLVVPWRRGAPGSAAVEQAAEPGVRIEIDDCHYRRLKPREHLRAQRFYDDYIVTGNTGEQTLQAGNAVPCNAAQWVGTRILDVLEPA
jgi:DNA (cytosine-5)-methyltransferase 1